MTWATTEFQNLFQVPSRNGVYKGKEYHGSGAKVINMGELFAYDRVGPQDMSRVQMSEQELIKSGVESGDLLFGRRSLVEAGAGRCALAWDVNEPTTFESSVIRVRLDESVADPAFYFYYFRSPHGRSLIRSIVNGATVKGIRGSDLQKLQVICPPVEDQQNIADRLRSFDDLIENNRRRIALLEESARLLYREWFVHLRFPGYEAVPMKDGVPEGWQRLPLSEVADFINGFAFKPEHLHDTGLPVVKIPELRDGISSKTPYNDGSTVPLRNHIDTGDVLFSWSASLLVNEWGDGPALLNQHLFKIVPKRVIDKRLVRFAVEAAIPQLLGHSVGATMQHIRRSALDGHTMLQPSIEIATKFAGKVDPMMDSVLNLKSQIHLLEETRDALLPKLMSGEIAV